MSENGGFEAVWLYIKALLPPGLDGALEPGGRENGNGIIPTNFHGLDSLTAFIKEYQAKKKKEAGHV